VPHDKEMYLRWAEVGAVSPMMMNDTACFGLQGHAPKWTLWSDDETISVYARLARLHTRLLPYWLTLAREASLSGVPPMRPLLLSFPDRDEAMATDDAFFLGPALFAAPVVRRGVRTRQVWLPPGRYVDIDTLDSYSGDQIVSIPAPLDKLPLLLVEGQLLPLLDESIETLAPATDGTVDPGRVADRLDVRVALGASGTASLALTDGTVLTVTRSPGAPPATSLLAVEEAQLADCALCFRSSTQAGLGRVRANGALASDSSIDVLGLHLSASGGPARRVRWDVVLLP
jgi:alpha-D-xyloside xylohydrolase